MIRNIIKYVGIALVLIGIFLVMKNLFAKDTDWSSNKNNSSKTYSANIKLLDTDTKEYLEGAKLVLKNENNDLIAEWTTTNEVYTIKNLEKGKYTLVQVEASKDYHLNENNVRFVIKNTDKDVIMYNTKMTEEEIKSANTTNTEVGVDNTASSKSIFTSIIAIFITVIGFNLIYKVKKNY